MTIARNHHWIPQCYLKGFAKARSKKSKLTVLDLIGQKTFETVPRNVASERDFNRLDSSTIDPNLVEKRLGELEGALDSVLGEIISKARMPAGDELVLLMNFIALMSVRNPRARSEMNRALAQTSEYILDIAMSSKVMWDSQMERLRTDGVRDTIEYEQALALHGAVPLKCEIANAFHVQQELEVLDAVIPCLLSRKWSLHVAPSACGGFVTSDHPVCLYWCDGIQRRNPPGHALTHTEVMFPISKELLAVGRFVKESAPMQVDMFDVAYANSVIACFARRQVYASTVNVLYLSPTAGTMSRGTSFVNAFAKAA